ncbi:hypothetical protein CQW23_12696 [Capsicum baccatum]|uniref:Factor of DNA methylation 1-5/IDN2 domain-containing protein n=1 Tax=Capsicum baccatum TaxID=33114 RepID=A0A2G2WT94_CAPBA|nr:hypothetical protein CQW23_12696 [Capsicum baccatum]
MKTIEDEGNQQVLKKADPLLKSLRDKEEEYNGLETLNQTLIVKEKNSNDELDNAKKELINRLKELSRVVPIIVRRMGELDHKVFHEAMKRNFNEEDERAIELCS